MTLKTVQFGHEIAANGEHVNAVGGQWVRREQWRAAMPKSELSWTNITRNDLNEAGQAAWDLYVEAKSELERALIGAAVDNGSATVSDGFKFSYARWSQGSIGMAIDAPAKAQRSGFAGLQRPTDQRKAEAEKLSDYLAHRQAQGRRY